MFALQETFDTSCLALVEQGEPAYDVGCRYLTAAGLRCAAGHLMTAPPEVVRNFTGGARDYYVRPHLEDHDAELVDALQAIHDANAWRAALGDASEAKMSLEQWRTDWLERACRVAQRFNLDPTRVLEAARAKGWTIPEGLS